MTPALVSEADALGGAYAWFERQLSPTTISDSAADEVFGWWACMPLSPAQIWQRHLAGVEAGYIVMSNYQRWLLMRMIRTNRQVHELMTYFWEEHLNVPVHGEQVFVHRIGYGLAIREHALGRFADLLQTAVTHPAMQMYLGGGLSTAAHPNENLGRELLELHSVGRGEYDEDDVKNSARILTGWKVDYKSGTWASSYVAADHYVGPVQVMDFTDSNTDTDGRALTSRYLTYLAHHPATARRIARKLCLRFVGDLPSSTLVDQLASIYLASDTDIRPVLRALVLSEEFRGATAKVRTPIDDVAATYRALGVQITTPPSPAPEKHAANVTLWQCNALGSQPHDWPQPNGQPSDDESWSSPGRFSASMNVHMAMSGGWWPNQGAVFPSAASWLPAPSVTLQALIEHVADRMLSAPASPAQVTACLQVLGYPPGTVITASHPVIKWMFPRLITTLLDSPQHMTR